MEFEWNMYTCYSHSYLQLLFLLLLLLLLLYTLIYYSIFLGRDSITTKHRHKYALTLLLLNVHPHFGLMTSPSKHHLSSLLAPSFATSPHHRVPQETYSFQPPKNTDFFPAIWHILSSSHKKRKKQSLVGGWATQKLFSSIWIILFNRGKFQDIFKRPLLIKHGLLENSVQYSIDDVSICFPAVNFINFPTSKHQQIQRHRSQGLNRIGPEDVVNPAVFAPAQLQLSQGSPNGAQAVQIPAAIPHTTVNAEDLATHHTG